MELFKKSKVKDQDELSVSPTAEDPAKKMGVRLAYLINILFAPTDQTKILTSLEAMTPDQIFDFYQSLEKRFEEFLVIHNEKIDNDYNLKIDELKNNYNNQAKSINKEVDEALNILDQDISQK